MKIRLRLSNFSFFIHCRIFFKNLIYKHECKAFPKNYCIVCKKDTENKNPKVFKTKNGRLILKSTCSECNNKKSKKMNYQ